MFCGNCGTKIDDGAVVCPNCGTPQQKNYNSQQPTVHHTVVVQQPPVVDNGGFLWGLLGCCIPIVGLILFLVWKDTKPKTAKAAGIGALISVIICVLYYLIIIVAGVSVGFLGI